MSTPIGPILDVTLRTLPCGCCVDDNDAIWSPCREIATIHAEAMAAVRAGVTAEPELRLTRKQVRPYTHLNPETGRYEPELTPPTLRDQLDDLARHVRRGEARAS